MVRLLLPIVSIMLLSACANTGTLNGCTTCTYCKQNCVCSQNSSCDDCGNCSHSVNAKQMKAEKPCKICMESERKSVKQ